MSNQIVSIIIQMRNNSTRLPYKVTKKIMGKYTMEYLIERVRKTKYVNNIIVATTTSEKDDLICDICRKLEVKFYRGDENNVLDRYYQAALISNTDIVVRVTGDTILLDPEIVDNMIKTYKENDYDFLDVEYSGEKKLTGSTAGFPDGFNVEIFSFSSLKKAYKNANKNQLEHVTTYLYDNVNCGKYKINLSKKYNNINFLNFHLSLDTQEDLERITNILKNLYPKNKDFTIDDVLNLLNNENI